MKVLGIGVDIVKNKRINVLIKKQNFIKRTFSKKEILFSKNKRNKLNYFAKRFAAKESFSKTLGTGIGKNLNFIKIINNSHSFQKDRTIFKQSMKLKEYGI